MLGSKVWRWTGTTLVCIALAACASGGVSGGLASPYMRPAGSDLFYSYGNFCGPGVPVAEGQPNPESIAEARALKPIDDIDLACQVHDLCYLRFGVQASCDMALTGILSGAQYQGGASLRCRRLASEVSTAVLLRAVVHNSAVNVGAAPATVPLGAVNAAMHGMVTTLYAGAGWPREGECMTGRPLRAADIRGSLTLARLYHEFGYDTNREAQRRYSESFTVEGYLEGTW